MDTSSVRTYGDRILKGRKGLRIRIPVAMENQTENKKQNKMESRSMYGGLTECGRQDNYQYHFEVSYRYHVPQFAYWWLLRLLQQAEALVLLPMKSTNGAGCRDCAILILKLLHDLGMFECHTFQLDVLIAEVVPLVFLYHARLLVVRALSGLVIDHKGAWSSTVNFQLVLPRHRMIAHSTA